MTEPEYSIVNPSTASGEAHKLEECDIAIVGAGPAGITASLWLSKLKVPHVLVDAREFPREKACGDAIGALVVRGLNEIDPEIIPDMFQKGILHPITGTAIITNKDKALRLGFRELDKQKDVHSCYSMKREHFDHYLFEKAGASKYCQVISPCFISGQTKTDEGFLLKSKQGHRIKTRLLLAATGSNATLGEKLNDTLKKEDHHFALGIRAYFKGIEGMKEGITELYLDRSLYPGGLYITPFGNNEFNLNIVVKKEFIKKKRLDPKQQFYELIKTHPILKQRFKNAEQLTDFKGSGLFLGTKVRSISGDGYMMIGDAAGLIDLTSANGIPQAMLSAKIAAEQAVSCLEANNFSAAYLAEYDKRVFKRVGVHLQLTRAVNPVLSSGIFRRLLFGSINFLANQENNKDIEALLYSRRPLLYFINPLFYFRLLRSALRKG